jgi:hypothetical protein
MAEGPFIIQGGPSQPPIITTVQRASHGQSGGSQVPFWLKYGLLILVSGCIGAAALVTFQTGSLPLSLSWGGAPRSRGRRNYDSEEDLEFNDYGVNSPTVERRRRHIRRTESQRATKPRPFGSGNRWTPIEDLSNS